MVDRQLVAIASALASDARLIIMDEPTTALSQREVAALLDVVKALKADGVSTLFVSHKLDEVAEISDRTVVLRNGEKTADRPAAEFDREALVAAMTGRTVEYGTLSVGPVAADAPIVLDVASLARAGSFDGVDLTIRAGEVLGITGLLGSGRNDLALSLFGLLPADTGTVTVDGRVVQLRTVQDALDAGIGLVPEDRLTEGLFLDHSIGDNIVIRTIDKQTGALGFTSPTKMKDAAWRWVDELSVKTPTISQPVSTLSGGNQQRVVLAKWLSAEPRVLILCGPTVGVDIGSKRQILDLLGTLAATGMAIIVISDDVPELLDVCHSIALMSEGRIERRFDRAAITEAELNTLLMSA
jgi:simple sugar transport system ATP-binding protein